MSSTDSKMQPSSETLARLPVRHAAVRFALMLLAFGLSVTLATGCGSGGSTDSGRLTPAFVKKVKKSLDLNGRHIVYTETSQLPGEGHPQYRWDMWYENENSWKKTVIWVHDLDPGTVGESQAYDGKIVYLFDSVTKTLIKKLNPNNPAPSDLEFIYLSLADKLERGDSEKVQQVTLRGRKAFLLTYITTIKPQAGSDGVVVVERYWIDTVSGELLRFRRAAKGRTERAIDIDSQTKMSNFPKGVLDTDVKYVNLSVEDEKTRRPQ